MTPFEKAILWSAVGLGVVGLLLGVLGDPELRQYRIGASLLLIAVMNLCRLALNWAAAQHER